MKFSFDRDGNNMRHITCNQCGKEDIQLEEIGPVWEQCLLHEFFYCKAKLGAEQEKTIKKLESHIEILKDQIIGLQRNASMGAERENTDG